MKPNGKKSARKSAVGKPFQKGPDPRRGHGCPPGSGGRPPNRIRQLAAELTDKHRLLDVLARIAAGDIEEEWLDHDGATHSSPTRNTDRINATKVILAYADAYQSDTPPDPNGDGPTRYVVVYLPANGR